MGDSFDFRIEQPDGALATRHDYNAWRTFSDCTRHTDVRTLIDGRAPCAERSAIGDLRESARGVWFVRG